MSCANVCEGCPP